MSVGVWDVCLSLSLYGIVDPVLQSGKMLALRVLFSSVTCLILPLYGAHLEWFHFTAFQMFYLAAVTSQGHGDTASNRVPRVCLENKFIAQISAGRYHSVALASNGALYTWGCGENGQLGHNSGASQSSAADAYIEIKSHCGIKSSFANTLW